jgi:lia operon protein LiaG
MVVEVKYHNYKGMNEMKRILMLLVLITVIYIVFTKGLDFNWFGSANTDSHTASISSTTDMIEMNVSSVSATVIPQNRNDLKAVYNGKEKLTVKENGDKVEVTIKNNWFDWFSWFSSGKNEKLTIYIPEDYNRGMSINLGSGTLAYAGNVKNSLEELSLDIGSGNLNLHSISANNFSLDGASGNVEIDSLKTKEGTIDLSSGNININHYLGPLNADVSSGRLNIQMDKLTGSIDVDLSSGLVNLDLPKNADFALNGEVSSGNISCDFPLTTTDTNHKNMKGSHGSGKHKVNLSVSSGLVHVY